MRIIGGEFRSRKLLTPRDDSVTRPIPDRVKESLFGLLRGHCEGASVFDAFAGTGAIGLEALSRGADRCVFVERSRDSAAILQANIDALGVRDRAEVVIGDALGPGALARAPRPLTLAFLDPPYPLIREPIGWKRIRTQAERLVDLLTPDGFLILRTPHPFLLEVPAEPAAPPAVAGRATPRPRPERRQKESRRRARAWDREHGRDAEPESAPPAPVEPEPPKARHIAGDLALANATGPESHAYATMALHLYMRR